MKFGVEVVCTCLNLNCVCGSDPPHFHIFIPTAVASLDIFCSQKYFLSTSGRSHVIVPDQRPFQIHRGMLSSRKPPFCHALGLSRARSLSTEAIKADISTSRRTRQASAQRGNETRNVHTVKLWEDWKAATDNATSHFGFARE